MGYLTPPPSPAPVIVYKDVGGLVTDYQAQTEIYRREGREVRLHECRSACTLALSLPNVCVYPDAQVKFHLAYNAVSRETDSGVSAELFDSYPAAVQGRLGHLTRQYKVLSGIELIALGIRNCNSDRTMIASAKSKQAPPPASADPLGELAQSVQGAVAKAFGGPNEPPQQPIRVAVADRKPNAPTMAHLDMTATGTVRPVPPPEAFAAPPRMPGDVRLEAGLGETPLPPRRPPSLAFTPEDAPAPYARLMAGAQPILSSTCFAPIRRGQNEN
ncbi:MAG: hypothetical protein C3F11_22085 [Methylocystaceae bacterium]|nr:MAG: hypothetical protein C3F11_22085 [Methylocystaceae bacterium]